MKRLLENLSVRLAEMGKSFKRNNSDSYKYGGAKKPKPKPKLQRPFLEQESNDNDDWREAFNEIREEDERDPKRFDN